MGLRVKVGLSPYREDTTVYSRGVDLKRAKALLEHYAESREEATVHEYNRALILSVNLPLKYYIELRYATDGKTLVVEGGKRKIDDPELLAKVGGCLIQLSNLMRQLKALEG